MEAATAPEGNRGSDDDPNKRNHGKRPDKAHYHPAFPRGIKLTKGRQRIQIQKIRNEEARLSAFSKRRSGIYKKANELVTLIGCQIGITGITPAGRTFSFANPCIEDIIHRFLSEPDEQPQTSSTEPRKIDVAELVLAAHRKVQVDFLRMRHDRLVEQKQVAKERYDALMQICRPFLMNPAPPEAVSWWELKPDFDLPDETVAQLSEELQNFRILNYENRLMRELGWPPLPPATATATATARAYGAGPSYPPPPPPPIQEPPMDNIPPPPPYNPPPAPASGFVGNVAVPDQNLCITGPIYRDEDDETDLAARYFGDDEGPSAGDF